MATHRDIIYLPNTTQPKAHSLNLFLPSTSTAESTKLPALVVFIHGGLWMDKDKDNFDHIGNHWRNMGVAVAIPNYRLSKEIKEGESDQDQVIHPEHTRDIANALSFLEHNAQEYHYDITQTIVVGHSCGAHMIGLLTLDPIEFFSGYQSTTCTDSNSTNTTALSSTPTSNLPVYNIYNIQAILGINGLFDLRLFGEDAPQWAKYVEYPFTADRTKWQSPIDYPLKTTRDSCERRKSQDIPIGLKWHCPPWIVARSNNDPWVNAAQSVNFVSHIQTITDSTMCNLADTTIPRACGKIDEARFIEMNGDHWQPVEWIGQTVDEITILLIELLKNIK
jgi:hypothetical protein